MRNGINCVKTECTHIYYSHFNDYVLLPMTQQPCMLLLYSIFIIFCVSHELCMRLYIYLFFGIIPFRLVSIPHLLSIMIASTLHTHANNTLEQNAFEIIQREEDKTLAMWSPSREVYVCVLVRAITQYMDIFILYG